MVVARRIVCQTCCSKRSGKAASQRRSGPSTLLLEARALEGLVTVEEWAPQPEDGDGNPLLEQADRDAGDADPDEWSHLPSVPE